MRTTQWKWMALGGLLCLLTIVVVSRWRDNQANASHETTPAVPLPLIGGTPPRVSELPPPSPVGPADPAVPTPGDNLPGTPPVGPMLPAIGGITSSPAPLPMLTDSPGTLPQVPTTMLPMPKDPPPAPQPLPSIQATQAFPSIHQGGGLMPIGFREQTPATAGSNPAPSLQPLTPPQAPPSAIIPPSLNVPPLQPPTVDPKFTQQAPVPPNSIYTPQPPAQPMQLSGPPPVERRPLAQQPVTQQAPAVSEPGEPPLTPAGPTQVYRVRHAGETVREIARKTLGTVERSPEIFRLNPDVRPEKVFTIGEAIFLPTDACIPADDVEAVKPLPSMRRDATTIKPKAVLPLTGTFPCNLDEKRVLTLPRTIREQLTNCPTLMISPGPDQCLWLTNQCHLDRLAERLEKSAAREVDVRVFKRLYFAQTEKIAMSPEGRITISDRLAQFAGLHQEVVLVGIDDHFELWDVARWRQYTQEKSAAARVAGDSE